jgi:O-antigen ligase
MRSLTATTYFHNLSGAATTNVAARASTCGPFLLSVTLCLSLFGYQIFAPWFQLISPEGSTSAIVLRVVILTLCLVCLIRYRNTIASFKMAAIPLFFFLALYSFRLADNFFIREFVWQAEPVAAFAFLIGGAIIPALVLQRLISKLDEGTLVATLLSMAIIFIAGLALNWDSLLVASQVSQASLEKLNPIALGFVASSLAMFFVIAPFRGFWAIVGKYILLTILIGVTIFSKSRGPLLATLLALFVYGLLTKGQHRRQLIRTLVLILLGIGISPIFVGTELFIVAFDRFSTMGVSDSANIDASAEARVIAWGAAWAQFLESPLFGDKVFEPSLRHYPHNLFLESLISLGIVGTIFLTVHIFVTATMVVRIFRRSNSSLGDRYIALIAIKELVAVQVSNAIWSSATFWIASACVIGIWVGRCRSLTFMDPVKALVKP